MPRTPAHGDPRHYESDIAELKAEIERLKYRLAMANKEIERAHLLRIEAQNPGIDMDDVRRIQARFKVDI